MNTEKYQQDISEIRDIMSRSTRFRSLSGFSGVIIGVIGLAGAFYMGQVLLAEVEVLTYDRAALPAGMSRQILFVAAITLIAALVVGFIFAFRESKRNQERLWNKQSQRVLINLLVPLATGGIVCLVLLGQSYIGILPGLTLIFYGLALINTGKYTIPTLYTLGLCMLLAGILAFVFVPYAFILWGIGFGVLHIVFGLYMHIKK